MFDSLASLSSSLEALALALEGPETRPSPPSGGL